MSVYNQMEMFFSTNVNFENVWTVKNVKLLNAKLTDNNALI